MTHLHLIFINYRSAGFFQARPGWDHRINYVRKFTASGGNEGRAATATEKVAVAVAVTVAAAVTVTVVAPVHLRPISLLEYN